MKAIFVRKAANLVQVERSTNELAYLFGEKAQTEVRIEKRITLSADEFREFSEDLLEDREFIKENKGLMYEDEDAVHCIAVHAEGDAKTILVNSEGYGYARYTASVVL